MPWGKCPLCESPIKIEEVRPYARLDCAKCHANLHLDKQGRLVVGEPRQLDDPIEELKQEFKKRASEFPLRKVVIGLAVFLVVVMVAYNLFGPAEQLGPVAEKAAKALADGDPDTLISLAAPDTTDDTRRWYETVHPQLSEYRQHWVGKTEIVQARVERENLDQNKGSVIVSIHPDFSGARDTSLADGANSTASAASSAACETLTDWTLTRWGRWKLDGRATFERVHRAQGPP
jgi:hypothetical protein